TVGVEVPNDAKEVIHLRDLVESERFRSAKSRLTLCLGKTQEGEAFTSDLDRMPHLLIAGSTGSGKSVGLNCMITSILYKATPDEVRFILIDPKMLELGIYQDLPHLLIPVVTDPKLASNALIWAVREMESRYKLLAGTAVRSIDQFNALLRRDPKRTRKNEKTGAEELLKPLPYIVVVVDELADLMMVASVDVELSICRLAQMARAVGIHLILATQRPSVDVITGLIKANLPARIAYRVSQRVDSRTILDANGAEPLLGHGDMLFLPPGSSRLVRLHGAYVTEAESTRIVEFLKKQARPSYDKSVTKDAEEEKAAAFEGERDEMYEKAVGIIVASGQASISHLQRRRRLGYARAARIIDMMEAEGIVGPGEGAKPREVLVSPEFLAPAGDEAAD
ncbi:MAG: DNA translocase FtsK, partial [Thermoplasmata archaeon]